MEPPLPCVAGLVAAEDFLSGEAASGLVVDLGELDELLGGLSRPNLETCANYSQSEYTGVNKTVLAYHTIIFG